MVQLPISHQHSNSMPHLSVVCCVLSVCLCPSANPPFVESIMNQLAHRIQYLLDRYPDAPFSVVVIVPAWTDCEGIEVMTASRFNRPRPGTKFVLEKKRHNYRPVNIPPFAISMNVPPSH